MVLALEIIGFLFAALALTLFVVYRKNPEDFKISAALLKVFTFSIEIHSPRQRELPGEPDRNERLDSWGNR